MTPITHESIKLLQLTTRLCKISYIICYVHFNSNVFVCIMSQCLTLCVCPTVKVEVLKPARHMVTGIFKVPFIAEQYFWLGSFLPLYTHTLL